MFSYIFSGLIRGTVAFTLVEQMNIIFISDLSNELEVRQVQTCQSIVQIVIISTDLFYGGLIYYVNRFLAKGNVNLNQETEKQQDILNDKCKECVYSFYVYDYKSRCEEIKEFQRTSSTLTNLNLSSLSKSSTLNEKEL